MGHVLWVVLVVVVAVIFSPLAYLQDHGGGGECYGPIEKDAKNGRRKESRGVEGRGLEGCGHE